MRIKEPPNEGNLVLWLEAAVRDIYAYLSSLVANRSDFIGVSITSDSFNHGPGGLSFRPAENFSHQDLWSLIYNITQSNDGFKLDDTFKISVTVIKIPHGASRRNLTIDVVNQKSLVFINNNDNLCLPRAIVVGKAYVALKSIDSDETRSEWKIIRDGRRMLQKNRAYDLVLATNVNIPREGCGVRQLEQFQNYYRTRYRLAIVVYEKTKLGNGEPPLFDGRTFAHQGVINLLYDEDQHHFDTILNLIGAAKSNFFCSYCNKQYAYVNDHKCKKICSSCFVSPPCSSENVNVIKCDDCNRLFFGMICFENHKKDGSYKKKNKKLCEIVKYCEQCSKEINRYRGRYHRCGVNYCKHCKTRHGFNELCFMQPIVSRQAARKNLFIFYDFETRQDTSYMSHPTTTVHIPNLCVAQQACTDCIENDNIEEWCSTCGIREYVFTENPVKQLISLCIREKSIFENIICIAHNARGFDAQFILKELAESACQAPPKVILSGQNIVVLSRGRTKFIDSLNYFSMKLSALPRAFQLPDSNKKGYFPHFFNTVENQNYEGPLPEAHFYGVDTMSQNERENFFKWYNKSKEENYNFIFKNEIVEYCRMDVEILRRACLAFRKIVLSVCNTDPFVSSMTIASCCSHIFRKNYLKPNTIGIIPMHGYRRADTHSQKSIEWLLQCEREIGREIIHAGRGREYRLAEGMLVDGFLENTETEEPRGYIWEFEGCIIHGCRSCFKTNRNKRMFHGQTLNEAYERTCAKINRMKDLGYAVNVIWECEFDRMKAENAEIANYVNNHPLMSKIKLNPRDAFYGGRTENIVTYYECRQFQRVLFYDFCSLYPAVCKRGKYPIGHPRIFVGSMCDELTGGDNNNLSRVEGLVKCRVLPPRNLFLPVLPTKMHGRLLFALCRTCCEQMQQTDCDHENESEREFTGVWVADELKKAVQLGYKISEIYIVWQYKITQYNQSTGKGGIFADYVNTFLKLKQSASGWPSHCTDDFSKQQYINDYLRDEGIQLEADKIEKNPGLRSVAKLMLNCIWGKFAQRSNLGQTDVIKTRETLLKLLLDPAKEVSNILPVNDTLLYARWAYREECVESAPHVNVVVAAYTTAQARLKLYEHLEKLGRRVLYFDTDSCVFVSHENDKDEYKPALGSLLGDMTDELKIYGDDTYIDVFLSGGPKFYCYKTFTPSSGSRNECCKVKGITLNFINSQKINFDTIKNMLLKEFDDEKNEENNIKLKFRAIRRMPVHDVVTRDETKTCSIVLKKRRYISHTESLPFGYKADE